MLKQQFVAYENNRAIVRINQRGFSSTIWEQLLVQNLKNTCL